MNSRSIAARIDRKRKLKARIADAAANDFMPRCLVPDPATGKFCGRPTARAAGKGLSAFHCRYHVQHRARHGSHWHKSYRAVDLEHYLKAALQFIDVHRFDPFISAALAGLDSLMQSAGPVIIATRLRGLPPRQRATVALARLREAGIKPERLLAIHLAVCGLIEEDPGSHRVREFRIVQVAKAAHRLASGYHRVWRLKDEQGRVVQHRELHAYPRSSGRVLRYLGEMIEQECELVADKQLVAVLALKISRYGPHSAKLAHNPAKSPEPAV